MRSVMSLSILAGCLGAAAQAVEFAPLAEPAQLGRLLRPQGVAASPLVIVLPDALGEDGRAELYAESLLARGVASLVLGLGEDLEAHPAPRDPAADPAAVPPALAWAHAAGFPLQGIGVMGFGLGGRAALLAATGRPVAALYPRCVDLHLPAEGDVLLLQGEDDSAGCETLAARPGIALQLLPGAAHGWDAPGAIWPSPGPKLADPAGGPPIPARTDGETMRAAAELVAAWFETRLLGHARSAAR
jgi:dienelactone hydrolase